MRASEAELRRTPGPGGLLAALMLLPASVCAQLYHWVDERGVPHYSDRPPPGGAERIEAISRPAVREARVASVIDGDTVVLDDQRRLRLIGIDAPEMPYRGRPGEPGAEAARAHLASLVEGSELHLQPGDTARDDYDRLLGYLRDDSGRDLGAEMLRAGWAVVSLHEDNAGHADAYFAAEDEARKAGRGLWAEPALQPLPAIEAGAHRNSYRQLEGRVVAARAGRVSAELRLEGELRLHVAEAARERFSGARLRALEGETVRVRGVIRQRDGHPLIHLRHPAQMDQL
ncbi:thermonuclease family protein [Algiphilus aromaticivorans]|uniref:thermonuclease family protein n=1 Tax=Algiphilus aromaticivorans TaxID=382454 RepID=UPI0009FF0505|nr:thermonuclease family protein [Algiphilus aromaticivorans]